MKKNFHLILLLLPIGCLGHMDPDGEIFPSVFVIDGEFHILFSDRFSEKEKSDWFPENEDVEGITHGVFKNIYSENGKIQESRSPLKNDESLGLYKEPKLDVKEEVQSCSEMKKRSSFNFPRPTNTSTTFYLTASDGHRKVLDWGEVAVASVGGFAATADSIIIVATVKKEKERNNRFLGTDLWMFHFDRSNGNMLFSQKVGDPTFIYHFPGVSNVIKDSGKVYFVWNQKAKEEGKEILHLIRYDIAKRKYYDIPLPYESTWNIKISVGMNKKLICLAYHGIGPELAVEFIPVRATCQFFDIRQGGISMGGSSLGDAPLHMLFTTPFSLGCSPLAVTLQFAVIFVLILSPVIFFIRLKKIWIFFLMVPIYLLATTITNIMVLLWG